MPKQSVDIALLNNRIRWRACFAVVTIALCVALTSIWPLYTRLKFGTESGLKFARDTGAYVVRTYIDHIRDLAYQVVSREQGAILASEYADGKITYQQYSNLIRKNLSRSLNSTEELVGITRIDTQSQVIASVGKPMQGLIDKLGSVDKQTLVGPIKEQAHYYFVVATPIVESGKRLGTSYTQYDITELQQEIHQKLQSRLGEIVLAYVDNHQIKIFTDNQMLGEIKSNTRDNPLYLSLVKAIIKNSSGMLEGKMSGRRVVVAYAPIKESHFSIAVIVEKATLFASIESVLHILLLTIVILTIIVLYALEHLLKPLAGKVVLHSQELEQRIEQGKVALRQTNAMLEHMIAYDALTEVLNRRGLEKKLEEVFSRIKRHQESALIFYLDVNHFKQINDTYGHEAGDVLLVELCVRLRQVLRKEDTIARLGGDEFLIIIEQAGKKDAATIKEKIKQVAKAPILISEQSIYFSISLGFSTYPEDGEDAQSLMKQADEAMYQDKRQKNTN